jgi:hypothetical protein
MAKKNMRSEKTELANTSSTPERRRAVRTPRKAAPAPNAPIAEPLASPAETRDTAAEMHKGGNGNGAATPTFEQIAEAAYHRYLKRGGHDGYDLDDWIAAEQSLRSSRR